jgi:hypothetical protein
LPERSACFLWGNRCDGEAELRLGMISIFFSFVGLGYELRASHLQSKCSTTWATLPVHFALLISWKWGLVNYSPRAGLEL